MTEITRRKFIKQAGALGLGLAAASLAPPFGIAADVRTAKEGSSGNPDIVAIKGENIAAMYRESIRAFGGIPVKKGNTVVIKPNMAWAIPPNGAANTSPTLLAAIIADAFQAGAAKVVIFDHTCDDHSLAYDKSGLAAAAKNAGADVAYGHLEKDYVEVDIPEGKTLKNVKVHKLIMESDVFINVPVMKHHGGAGLSCAMKNLMGAVWDRRYYHAHGLNQCVADACLVVRPDLNIIDGYKIMLSGGPRSNNASEYRMAKTLILAKDIVAADTASALTFGKQPGDFPYIEMGEAAGIGTTKLDRLNIKRIIM